MAPAVSEKLGRLNAGSSIPVILSMPIKGTVNHVMSEDESPKDGIVLSSKAVRSCNSFQPMPFKSAHVAVEVMDSISAEPLDNPGKAFLRKQVLPPAAWNPEAAKSLVDMVSPIGWPRVQFGNHVINFGLQHDRRVADLFPRLVSQLARIHDRFCSLQNVINCYDVLTSLSLYVECDELLCLYPRLNGVVRHDCCVCWSCYNDRTDTAS